MEELVEEGKVKSIGLSNFNAQQVSDILKACTIRPVCNQFEIHPMLQCARLVEFCQQNEIVVVAFAPLGAPDRTWGKPGDPSILEQPELVALAAKKGRSVAQIILRWLVQVYKQKSFLNRKF